MWYWLVFAAISFLSATISLVQNVAGELRELGVIPDFVGGMLFAVGVFCLQTAQYIRGSDRLSDYLTERFDHVLFQIDQEISQVDDVRDLVQKNEQLKMEIREMVSRIENRLANQPIKGEEQE